MSSLVMTWTAEATSPSFWGSRETTVTVWFIRSSRDNLFSSASEDVSFVSAAAAGKPSSTDAPAPAQNPQQIWKIELLNIHIVFGGSPFSRLSLIWPLPQCGLAAGFDRANIPPTV